MAKKIDENSNAVAFDAALCESFPVTSDQIEILKAIDEAGGRLKAATINSSDERRKAADELRTNRFLTCSKAVFEMTANGRALLESHRICQQELEVMRLKMSVDDYFAGKKTKPVPDQTPGDATQVTAEPLAGYAGCTERVIRDVLKNCPVMIDKSGRKSWRYCDALPVLRKWCEEHTRKKFKSVVWPDVWNARQKKK